jgi:hypothetical protein
MLEVAALFQIALSEQEFGIAFFRRHATPDFRHEQADVVIHAKVRADKTGRRDKCMVAGENERHERVVEINDRWQRVERAFGERAL